MPPVKRSCPKGKRLSKDPKKKGKCVKKAKANKSLTMWRKAANAEGYLQKGNFKPLPKKGTPGYARIRTRYLAMMK